MSTTNIYILRLSGGKYYVGQSNNLEQRHKAHVNGTASAWTKKYKPVAVDKIIRDVSYFEEDKWTKIYMDKYGIHNVRGGSYTEIELSEFQEETLKTEIWGAKGLCKNCGRSGHFAKGCYAKTDVYGNAIDYEGSDGSSISATTSDSSEYGYYESKKGKCYKCGRAGHYSPDCYARTHVKGYML